MAVVLNPGSIASHPDFVVHPTAVFIVRMEAVTQRRQEKSIFQADECDMLESKGVRKELRLCLQVRFICRLRFPGFLGKSLVCPWGSDPRA